ncbi:MAG: helix-turn-helix transcriptional regulator [Planctomycetia bacterium]|nr:helix-turn-helix transcriptional regulator [Planctomycetia bacterium]
MTDSIYTARYQRLREILAEARKSKGLSQKALADKLGRIQTFVSKYERGERRLDVVEFLDVAAALNLEPVEVLRKILARGGK